MECLACVRRRVAVRVGYDSRYPVLGKFLVLGLRVGSGDEIGVGGMAPLRGLFCVLQVGRCWSEGMGG